MLIKGAPAHKHLWSHILCDLIGYLIRQVTPIKTIDSFHPALITTAAQYHPII